MRRSSHKGRAERGQIHPQWDKDLLHPGGAGQRHQYLCEHARVKGLSAFIVEKGFPGFSVGKIEDQMGMRGTPAAELVMQDCVVPAENLLGRKARGHGGDVYP